MPSSESSTSLLTLDSSSPTAEKRGGGGGDKSGAPVIPGSLCGPLISPYRLVIENPCNKPKMTRVLIKDRFLQDFIQSPF